LSDLASLLANKRRPRGAAVRERAAAGPFDLTSRLPLNVWPVNDPCDRPGDKKLVLVASDEKIRGAGRWSARQFVI
jgi:hypothetical protein